MASSTRSPSPSSSAIKITNLENGDPVSFEDLYTGGINVLQDVSAYLLQRVMRLDANRSLTFTADAAADTLSFSAASGAVDGMPVVLSTSGTLPAGWSTKTVYFLRDVSSSAEGGTAKLALTSGGSAVTITDAGTGAHALKFLPYGETPATLTDASHTITPYAQAFVLATPTTGRTITLYDSRAVAGQACLFVRGSAGAFNWTITRETSGDSVATLTGSKACSVLMMAFDNGSGTVRWHPLFLSVDAAYGIDP